MTSVTAWMLCSIMAEAGLPAGVVNMVFGYGATAGEAIVTHPKVNIIRKIRNFHVDTFGFFGYSDAFKVQYSEKATTVVFGNHHTTEKSK